MFRIEIEDLGAKRPKNLVFVYLLAIASKTAGRTEWAEFFSGNLLNIFSSKIVFFLNFNFFYFTGNAGHFRF